MVKSGELNGMVKSDEMKSVERNCGKLSNEISIEWNGGKWSNEISGMEWWKVVK